MSKKIIFDAMTWKYMSLVVIIFTIILSSFLVHYGIKIKQDDYCKSDYSYDFHNEILLSDIVLSSENSYYLEKNTFNNNLFKDFTFVDYCYTFFVNSSKTLFVDIINDDNITLGSSYVSGVDNFSQCLPLDNLSNNDFVGIRCNNCDINNNITLQHEILSSSQYSLYNNSGSLLFFDDSLKINSYYRYFVNCDYMYNNMLSAYYTVVGILFALWLILLGVQWLKDALWGDWL